MKNKAIISLMLIAMMVASSTIAFATSITFSTGSLSDDGWTLASGHNLFGGTFGTGVYSTSTDASDNGYSRAVYPMSLNTSGTGAFSCTYTFKLNNLSSRIWLGVSSDQAGSALRAVGYNAIDNKFVTTTDMSSFTNLSNTAPETGAEYTATVSSTDGKNIAFAINQGATSIGSTTATLPGSVTPAYLLIQINNRGATGGPTTSPVVTRVEFVDNSAPTNTGNNSTNNNSTTPSGNGTTVQAALDLQAIRDYYYNLPAAPMSDQNAVLNPDGTYSIPTMNLAKTTTYSVSGSVTNASDSTPISGAAVKFGNYTQVTGSGGTYKFTGVAPGQYDVTASASGYNTTTQRADTTFANATLNFALHPSGVPANQTGNQTLPTTATATPAATAKPSATKTQSPGFGIAITAIGVFAAVLYISGKKKK